MGTSLGFRSLWGFDIFMGLPTSAFFFLKFRDIVLIYYIYLHVVLSWFGFLHSFLLGFRTICWIVFSTSLSLLRLTGYTYRTFSLLDTSLFFLAFDLPIYLQCVFVWVFAFFSF